jgi:Tfp pilus assembly protein FimV
VKEVDRKRLDDYEKIRTTIKDLGATLASQSAQKPSKRSEPPVREMASAEKPPKNEKGFEYTVKSGDTISAIIAAYREQNIKVTEKQIMQANPGLVPEKMRLGQKIWIPAPQQ